MHAHVPILRHEMTNKRLKTDDSLGPDLNWPHTHSLHNFKTVS